MLNKLSIAMKTTLCKLPCLFFLCGSAGAALSALLATIPLAHAVEVTNVKDGEVFRYPLVVIEGTCRGKLQFKSAAEASLDTTVADKFRGVVELKAGRNELAFKDDAGVKTLALTYKPATAEDYRVKVWYVVPKDEDPLKVKADQVDALYQTKLDLLTKVMQSWVAEDMKCGGYGAKTFYPEMRKDAPSKVDVGLLYTNQTRAQWSAQGNSYDVARSVLPPQYATPKWRNLAFITCANVAQSSDNFCVIGYGTLVGKSPVRVSEIVKWMQTPEPDAHLGALSYRAFTGVTLHEFGHMIHWAWHPGGYNLIQDAYENVAEAFTVAMDPGVPHNEAARSSYGIQQELFNNSRFYWKTGDKQTYKDGAFTFAAKDGKFTVKADHPLGAVFYYLPDANTQVAKLDGKQGKTWEMNIADIVKALGSAGNFSYMAVDVEGNEAHSFYVPPAAAK